MEEGLVFYNRTEVAIKLLLYVRQLLRFNDHGFGLES